MSCESPTLATPMPCTNTVLEPLLIRELWGTQHLKGGQGTNIRCFMDLSPLLETGMPLAKTVPWLEMVPILLVHLCPVLPISPCLHKLGMPVFMCTKNRWYYNLNLENWPFLTSCLMPPTMYDSTSVSCGATCMPLLDSQCCVQCERLGHPTDLEFI